MAIKYMPSLLLCTILFAPFTAASAETEVKPSPNQVVRLKATQEHPFTRREPRLAPGSNSGSASSTSGAPQIAPPRNPTYCETQEFVGIRCARLEPIRLPTDPPVATAEEPTGGPVELTEGEILTAIREIEMPSLDIVVQPGESTLVNVPTIFHTSPRAVNRSVDLLGNTIDVEATATSFTWHHGDGTRRTTSRPGRPYPAKDVTHTYQRAAALVRPRVDTTYTVRYRINGGSWSDLGQTLTATGTPTRLSVRQAAPVLTRP